MKKILFILCTLGFVSGGFSQFNNAKYKQNETKRADKYFDRAFYADAIPLYEELVRQKRSRKVVQNLADSYYNLGSYKSAARWYRYLTSNYSTQIDEEYFFKYVQTLKAIGDYEGAKQVQRTFFERRNDQKGLNNLERELKYLENVEAIGNRYELENLRINTTSSEFGMVSMGDDVIFAAPKKEFDLLSAIYRWNGEGYLDLYRAPKDRLKYGDSVAVSFADEVNSKMHEANAVFTKDGKTMYFTRNNFVKGKLKGKKVTDGKKVTHLSIYKGRIGRWRVDPCNCITLQRRGLFNRTPGAKRR